MTQEQAERLCKFDPTHFGIMMGALWFDMEGGKPLHKGSVVCNLTEGKATFTSGLYACLWWMASTMTERYEFLVHVDREIRFTPEFCVLDSWATVQARELLCAQRVIDYYIHWITLCVKLSAHP